MYEDQHYLIGSYKIHLATTQSVAEEVLSCAEQGRDLSSIDSYVRDVEAVTLDGVKQTFRKYVQPSRFVMVLAGTVPGAITPLQTKYLPWQPD